MDGRAVTKRAVASKATSLVGVNMMREDAEESRGEQRMLGIFGVEFLK